MDTRDGRIYDKEELLKKLSGMEEKDRTEEMKHFKEMVMTPTVEQMKRIPPKVGRNEPCPCESGLKFKKCCLEEKELTLKEETDEKERQGEEGQEESEADETGKKGQGQGQPEGD